MTDKTGNFLLLSIIKQNEVYYMRCRCEICGSEELEIINPESDDIADLADAGGPVMMRFVAKHEVCIKRN